MVSTIYIYKTIMTFQDFISRAELNYNSYQDDGVQWCVTKETSNDGISQDYNGGIVADEMGLGKTITMLGTMYLNPLPYTLIVVPVVLIEQWYEAIKSYLHIEPIIYHGQNKSPFMLGENINRRNQVIAITTYGVLSQPKPRYTNSMKVRPSQLVRNDYLNAILYNIREPLFMMKLTICEIILHENFGLVMRYERISNGALP